MRAWVPIALLACLSLGAGDLDSGPGRTTVQTFSWGTVYYDAARLGASELRTNAGSYKLDSSEGRVSMDATDGFGARLSSGGETLILKALNGGRGLEILTAAGTWTLETVNGDAILTGPRGRGSLTYRRTAGSFSIQGPRGTVTVSSDGGDLRIQSPLGLTTIRSQPGDRTISGPALDRIPYLGRGIFFPFHGAGLFLDLTRIFAMPELAPWLDWNPIQLP